MSGRVFRKTVVEVEVAQQVHACASCRKEAPLGPVHSALFSTREEAGSSLTQSPQLEGWGVFYPDWKPDTTGAIKGLPLCPACAQKARTLILDGLVKP